MDVDFLVDGSRRTAILSALATAGFAVEAETPEVLHLGGPGPLVLLANRSPTRAMLASAPVEAPLGIKCVQVEDLIGLKIQAFCNDPHRALQDQADIVALAAANPAMDWNRVKAYADLFDTWPVILELKSRYGF